MLLSIAERGNYKQPARSGGGSCCRQPIVAPDLDAFLRQILANLAGVEEHAISGEDLQVIEEMLGLGVGA